MRFEVQAILFDIDGTLVDSTPAVERTWRSWAAARGMDGEAILAVSHGRRSEDTIADVLPPGQRAAAVVELEQMELDDLDSVVALPAAGELLAGLPPGAVGRRDVRLAPPDAGAAGGRWAPGSRGPGHGR